MTADLFTRRLIRKVEEAWKRNIDETDSIYHHPTESRIVEKTIDLRLPRPMCKPESPQPKNPSDFDERWLEAYLIDKAKKQNWMLELQPGMSCRLLYSQLRFRKKGVGQQESSAKHLLLDLLLYDKNAHNVVILELKKERVLREARRELDEYNRLLWECKDGLIQAFDPGIGLRDVKGAVSYVILPEIDSSSKQNVRKTVLSELGPYYGLLEYHKISRPWEMVVNGEPPEVKLKLVHEATPKKWK